MRRIVVYDHLDNLQFELSENDVFELMRRDTVNGEHSLQITTTRVLERGQRIILQDDRGKWHEYVVYGVDQAHGNNERIVGSYYCVWSLMPDLQGTHVSSMPGVQTPVAAGTALEAALAGTSRWKRGTVTNTATGGASMYDTDGWSALSTLVKTWGGEVDTTIEVSVSGGVQPQMVERVQSRKVDLYSKMGEQSARRRFDFGADVKSVKREIEDGPLYCRISPRGKGEQSGDGYGRKITIESVNDGKDYLENPDMVDLAKLPNGKGGWEYPTLMVENSKCETPEDLLEWAQGVLEQYTLPRVSYSVDVVQLGREGIDAYGVSLGDVVNVVDGKFGDGLRLSARVIELTTDELAGKTAKMTLGTVKDGIESRFKSVSTAIEEINEVIEPLSTAEYINELIDRINAEINATGGYTYITEGQGLRTYDVAVSDPLVGSEASRVVEIKGGSIRIADSRTAQGDWYWRSVFTSGHIAADMVTAAHITTGYIGNASGSYWDLDAGLLNVSGGSIVGSHIRSPNRNIDIDLALGSIVGGMLLRNSRYSTDNLYALISPGGHELCTVTRNEAGTVTQVTPYLHFGFEYYDQAGVPMTSDSSSGDPYGLKFGMSGASIAFQTGGYAYINANNYLTVNPVTRFYNTVRVTGEFIATGAKTRQVSTENYDDRLLYCYETPSPMFGDVGSAVIGEDGTCFVSIDDIFSETVRTDYAYQVFLQKCGDGDIWVDEKAPTHFVVRGTPGLAFDWEMKARQSDFADLRIENRTIEDEISMEKSYGVNPDDVYEDEYRYINEMEARLYETA